MYGYPPPPWQTSFYMPTQPNTDKNEAIRFLKHEIKRLRAEGDGKKKEHDKKKEPGFSFGQHMIFWMAMLPFLGLLQIWVFCEVIAHAYNKLHPVFH